MRILLAQLLQIGFLGFVLLNTGTSWGLTLSILAYVWVTEVAIGAASHWNINDEIR